MSGLNDAFGRGGTDAGIKDSANTGNLSVNNFRDAIMPNAEEAGCVKIRVKMENCRGCPVRCKKVAEVKDGPFKVHPEYGSPVCETSGALGTNCGIVDIRAISAANERCNAMECVEKGLLSNDDIDGVDLLAEGSLRAATKIGDGAEAFAIQVKGLELPMHEHRVQYGLAVGYMVPPPWSGSAVQNCRL